MMFAEFLAEFLASWLFLVLFVLPILMLGVSALAGCYVSGEKSRGGLEGLLLGLFLGPVGVIVAALMPAPARPVKAELTPLMILLCGAAFIGAVTMITMIVRYSQGPSPGLPNPDADRPVIQRRR
jgi:hypothetical protein